MALVLVKHVLSSRTPNYACRNDPPLPLQFVDVTPSPPSRSHHSFNAHISGTPSPGCRAGRPDASSTSARCSGSGKHAAHHISMTFTRKFKTPFTHVADPPSNGAFLRRRRGLVGLAVDAKVHDVVAADGAVVDDDIPCPECNGVPLCNHQYAFTPINGAMCNIAPSSPQTLACSLQRPRSVRPCWSSPWAHRSSAHLP